jgi:23S rRNA pseudouridine1911/1915/1917 synthase
MPNRWVIHAADTGVRLDAWLARQPEVGSRARARAWIERGKVFLNDVPVGFPDAGYRLQRGDGVRLWVDRPGSASAGPRGIAAARARLRIVYEDASLLAADKPPGLLVEPLPDDGRRQEAGRELTLLHLVADHLREAVRLKPLVVHRIDRDTSGLVLFAKTRAAQEALKDQFERREPERIYLAIVAGVLDPPRGSWRDRLVWDKERLIQRRAHPRESRAKDAMATFRVLEQFERAAAIEVALVTGKRNQIRVQAGLRGHPVLGEKLYRFDVPPDNGALAFPRQALHAARLGFVHPATGRRLRLTAPTPADLEKLLARLRRGSNEQ